MKDGYYTKDELLEVSKKEDNTEKEKRYCRHCGKEMIMKVVGAEKLERFNADYSYHPYAKYNGKTGKRQYVYLYKCSSSRWYNNHDEIFIDKVYVEGDEKWNTEKKSSPK